MGIKDLLNDSTQESSQITASPVDLIINNKKFLSQKCQPASIVEAEELWPVLKATVKKHDGFGIAANQIGILKAVAFIEFKGKEYKLLNPRIISVGPEKTLVTDESCLSFPKKSRNTVRFTEIIVEDDYLGNLTLNIESDDFLPIIFQHEIDHLNGRTIFDAVQKPQKVSSTPPRNSPCPCGSGKKYKKCCINKG